MNGLQQIWSEGDAVSRGVALLLLAMSVSAWVLIFWKSWVLGRARRDLAVVVPAFWRAPDLDAGPAVTANSCCCRCSTPRCARSRPTRSKPARTPRRS